jgi:hypothetical protein
VKNISRLEDLVKEEEEEEEEGGGKILYTIRGDKNDCERRDKIKNDVMLSCLEFFGSKQLLQFSRFHLPHIAISVLSSE